MSPVETCTHTKSKDKRLRNWNENSKHIYRIVYRIDLEKCSRQMHRNKNVS